MSQEQPRIEEGIKYGDVFNVQGDLAKKTVAPVDAAMMQKAESAMLGKTQKNGAAATMQSAAMKNERGGAVKHDEMSKGVADGGVIVTETGIPGRQVISESVGGQVLHTMEEKERNIHRLCEAVEQSGQKVLSNSMTRIDQEMSAKSGGGAITIGEALEATVLTAGKKAVEWSDAAAIQAAEVRATGRTNIVPGGVAAAAQSAATLNARATKDENKTKLADILSDAKSKLPSDRAATRRDAEGVTGAEMRNDPNLTTHPGGVSASVAAAARLNQNHIHN